MAGQAFSFQDSLASDVEAIRAYAAVGVRSYASAPVFAGGKFWGALGLGSPQPNALDVDHFKDVNDTFGHLVGDGVVREVGTLLRGAARAGDVVARTGGDEFMLLLPDTDEPGALQVAARIRDAFRQRQWETLPEKHRLTASVGAVADRAADADLAEALLARADEALYAAKRSGRDRVFVWQHGILRPVTGAYRVPDPAELSADGPGADGAPAGEGTEGAGERGATGDAE